MSTATTAPIRLALDARAIGQPLSVDDAARTIDARIYSGESVTRTDGYGNTYALVLDPAGLDASRVTAGSCPFIDSHSTYSIDSQLGSVVAVWTADGEIFARFQVSPRPEIDGVWQDLKAGTVRGVSMGLILLEWADELGDNGALAKRTATKWQIYEVSLVTVPADPRAVTLSLNQEPTMQTQQNTNTATTAPVQLSAEQAADVRARVQLANLPTEFAETLIGNGQHGQQATTAIFAELVRRDSVTRTIPHASLGREYADGRMERMMEGLTARLTGKRPSDDAREYAGKRMADLARECLTMRSVDARGSDARVIELAMTTSDFPNLLTGTGQRMLLDAYQAAQPAIKQLARRSTATDYRPKNILQLSQTPSLEKVNEGGEIEYGGMAEGKEAYSVEDYARIVALSNKALTNDDLGAFSDFTRKFGVSAAQREAALLVDLLTSNSGVGPTMNDAKALFHSGHKNIGTPGALSINTLSEARKLMRAQTDLDASTVLNVEPRYLLVPSALETSGEQMLATIVAGKPGDVNPFSQKLTLVVEPRLDAKSLSRYYLWGDPAIAPVLEISFLVGTGGGPQISSRVAFEKLGMEFRCVLTVGVGAVDYRGVVTNAG